MQTKGRHLDLDGKEWTKKKQEAAERGKKKKRVPTWRGGGKQNGGTKIFLGGGSEKKKAGRRPRPGGYQQAGVKRDSPIPKCLKEKKTIWGWV